MASWKHTALAATIWTSGPPCTPGKTILSIAAAYCCFDRMMPERGPRSVLCVVDVTMSAVSQGLGCRPAATNPENCSHSVGDPAEPREIENARICAASGDDQFGLVLVRQPFDLVIIDALIV